MDRTPYLGDVAVVVHPGKKEMGTPLADTPTRPVTRHGGMRDLHESSFSLSGTSKGHLDWTLVSTTVGWQEEGRGARRPPQAVDLMLLFLSIFSLLAHPMSSADCWVQY